MNYSPWNVEGLSFDIDCTGKLPCSILQCYFSVQKGKVKALTIAADKILLILKN